MGKNWKRARNVAVTPIMPRRYYIFCEGKKTEPNYFMGIKNNIERKAIYKNNIYINVQGVGRGTLKVIEAAEDYVKKNSINNAEVWLVYDKDEFTDDDFNMVSTRARQLSENNKNVAYNVAWSNQCIEYWFILYFDYYTANNDRKYYVEYLDKKFKEIGAGKYEKNLSNIFEILESYGDADQAVKFADKRLAEFKNESDAKSAPATKVHLLYNHLKPYFK